MSKIAKAEYLKEIRQRYMINPVANNFKNTFGL